MKLEEMEISIPGGGGNEVQGWGSRFGMEISTYFMFFPFWWLSLESGSELHLKNFDDELKRQKHKQVSYVLM